MHREGSNAAVCFFIHSENKNFYFISNDGGAWSVSVRCASMCHGLGYLNRIRYGIDSAQCSRRAEKEWKKKDLPFFPLLQTFRIVFSSS